MKKLLIIWFFSLIVISLSFCRKDVNGPGNEINNPKDEGFNVPHKDLVALKCVFTENYSGLLLLDYYDPSNYKIVKDPPACVRTPRFSANKDKIIFNTKPYAPGAGYSFALYDVNKDTVKNIRRLSGLNLYGERPVWKYDGSGFYYYVYLGGVYFYQFDTQLDYNFGPGNFLIHELYGLKGTDTLMVYGYDKKLGKQSYGNYFTDHEGSFLTRIDNPYLEPVHCSTGIISEYSKRLRWNSTAGLFVCSEYDSTLNGRKISVTNLDGSYYRSYTSGDYTDDYPVWGPEGKTILFNRTEWIVPYFYYHGVMIIDVETGEVSKFINPETINGAIRLWDADY
ncbi:hypothetical protein AMJ80_08580 [bacterium SM23_31]|nr:MAG: hypothetical protein AMJ80_08580 [bacterium SM23_31]